MFVVSHLLFLLHKEALHMFVFTFCFCFVKKPYMFVVSHFVFACFVIRSPLHKFVCCLKPYICLLFLIFCFCFVIRSPYICLFVYLLCFSPLQMFLLRNKPLHKFVCLFVVFLIIRSPTYVYLLFLTVFAL